MILAGALGLAAPLPAYGAGPASDGAATALGGKGTAVTLLTGDTVSFRDLGTGSPQYSVDAAAREDGRRVTFHAEGDSEAFYVFPTDVMPYVSQGDIDRELFNVTALAEQDLDDKSTDRLPLIIGYDREGHRSDRTLSHAADSLPGTTGSLGLSTVQAAGTVLDRDKAAGFWRALSGDGDGLAKGVTGIDFDSTITVDLAESVPQIGAPQAWDDGHTGTGVTVAVLDTGVDATHPDLKDQVVEAANFTDDDDATDGHGHGTHVAATIAGTGAASDGKYAGVAPGAKLLSGKVLSAEGEGSSSWIIAGMEWAVANKADVVGMSLGGGPTDGTDPLSEAVNELSASGDTLFVIAAGNSGPGRGTVATPGAADAALTVGAVDKSDQIAEFSSRGPRVGDYAVKPEITAPGTGIVAARATGTAVGEPVNDRYTSVSGTSMATPHVAGAAALLADARADLRGPDLKDALVSTAEDGGFAWYEQGSGRVDVPRSIGQNVYATATADFGDLSRATGPVNREVVYTNDTGAAVTLVLDSAVTDHSGARVSTVDLSDETITVPAGERITVTATVDGDSLDPGSYGGVITATAGETKLRTSVGFGLRADHNLTVNVNDSTGKPAGFDWIVTLINDSYDPADPNGDSSYVLNVSDGVASARVPAGTYTAITAVYEGDFGNWVLDRVSLVTELEFSVEGDTEITLNAADAVETKAKAPKTTDVRAHWVSVNREYANVSGRFYSMYENSEGAYPIHVSPTRSGQLGYLAVMDMWTLAEPKPLKPVENNAKIEYSQMPGYSYHLPFYYPNGVPDSLDRTVSESALSKVHTTSHADNPKAVYERSWVSHPSNGSLVSSSKYYVAPGKSVEYMLADDRLTWTRATTQLYYPSAGKRYYQIQWSWDRYVSGGASQPDEHWFQAPSLHGGAVDLRQDFLGNPVGVSTAAAFARGGPGNGEFVPGFHAMDNSDGHFMTPNGQSDLWSTWRMWNADTGAEIDADWKYARWPVFPMASGAATYRLKAVDQPIDRTGDLFQTGTKATTEWTFDSAPSNGTVPEGYTCGVLAEGGGDTCRFQPVVQLRYDLNLDIDNHASAAGQHPVTVYAGSHSQVTDRAPVTRIDVRYSTDGGTTWDTAPPQSGPADGRTTVVVDHPPLDQTDGTVWLKISAEDSQGNTVVSTVERAYLLK